MMGRPLLQATETGPSLHRVERISSPAPSRIPALDGVRGVAILLVLMFHQTILVPQNRLDSLIARLGGMGWVGVDLFFVLSGFLITGILLDAKGQAHYFRNFYARRVLRIFPLYYAVVFVSLVVLPHIHHPKAQNFGRVRGDEVWYWTYLSNFIIAKRNAWRHGILDVSWSLAIEEQFYLFWPTIVLLCSRRVLMGVCGILIGGALVFRTVMAGAGADTIFIFVSTPSYVDALAIGALLAAVARGAGGMARWIRPAWAVVVASASLLVVLFVTRNETAESPWMQTAGFSTLAILFGGVLVLASSSAAPAAFFAHPLLRTFGKYSYALYLFNLPLRAVVRDSIFTPEKVPALLHSRIPGQLLFYLAATAISFVAAFASWHLYEKHFLRLKRFFPERKLSANAVVAGPVMAERS